jgi:hypothetical protein
MCSPEPAERCRGFAKIIEARVEVLSEDSFQVDRRKNWAGIGGRGPGLGRMLEVEWVGIGVRIGARAPQLSGVHHFAFAQRPAGDDVPAGNVS